MGEIPDLKLLVDWCKKTGISLIQLLPLNEMGFHFRPYDAESSFALESMHLSLDQIRHVRLENFTNDIKSLRGLFPISGQNSAGPVAAAAPFRPRVTDVHSGRDGAPRALRATPRILVQLFDTGVKKAKLNILLKMFGSRTKGGEKYFSKYKKENAFWLEAYVNYKVLKDKNNNKSWEEWPVGTEHCSVPPSPEHEFHAWLQWQLFLQFREVKNYANKHGVFLMGDLPFLVARDSADVWANRSLFKLEMAAGAPPDLYLADGQQWGMPPYHWKNMEAHGYDYLIQKLKYAENFYDLFRIDHFVGIFRIWTFPAKAFDPPEEALWEARGRKILDRVLKNTRMLPCAEDLGCVPDCSFKVLEEYSLPGVDVQRWMRDWKETQDFKEPGQYRKNSVAVISTHDMAPLKIWWETETNPEEREKFWKMLNGGRRRAAPTKATPAFIKACLEKISEANSVFSVQLWQDWLSLGGYLNQITPEERINVPGTVSKNFWRLQMPISLEKMRTLPINRMIKEINKKAGRI